jgi:hypothetical protein
MKIICQVLCVFLFSAAWFACDDARYIDLKTGERIRLEKDSVSGLMVDSKTKKIVHIYVDTRTDDTIYGPTGKVINGNLWKNDHGGYTYSGEVDDNTPENVKIKVEE